MSVERRERRRQIVDWNIFLDGLLPKPPKDAKNVIYV
jgi:hypothetical protein